MTSLRQFSVTHIVIVLIFGFILVSSCVTAARVMDIGGIDCHLLDNQQCGNKKDCASQCEQAGYTAGSGICIPDPSTGIHKPIVNRCCCLY
ncbi:hypothetical protein MKW92_017013 [Papaver armeniacum]|nr:hypothetical protein MKW92_017013 [Papaver armeniacum]